MVNAGLILSLRGMWQGGQNYYHNLLRCLQQYPNPAIRLAVFTDHEQDVARYQGDAIAVHRCPAVALGHLWNWPRRRLNGLLGYDPVLLRILERRRIDILSHRSLGRQRSINTLPWLADFQHKRFPQFFAPKERANRDTSVANVALWGNILLSSHAAANDFRRYYPQLAAVATRVLHFSSAAVLDVVPLGREELAARCPVREPYFFLPNQFWQHKNHAAVVDALRQTPAHIRVICTGLIEDTRDAAYAPALLDKVKRAGLEHRFLCLGTVPYAVMVSLMHHSLAVLQPSLFEGWSTSVEESRAMGKIIILSDIDVHREQAPERGVYFSPASPEELAARMQRVYMEFSPQTEQGFVEQRPQRKVRAEREWIQDYVNILGSVAATSAITAPEQGKEMPD